MYSFYQHIRARIHATFFFLFFFFRSFPFPLILSIQADNPSDAHSDTQTRAAATSDMRDASESALQCINLGDKTGFSIINYLFSPFYLLFIPLCCIPLTVFVFYSFSHSLSAFSASPFSYLPGCLNTVYSPQRM